MTELVACLICGIERKSLCNHLRSTHCLTVQQYRAEYGGDTISASTRRLQVTAAKKRMASPEARLRASESGRRNIMRLNAEGKGWRMPVGHHTEEHKQRMSELMMGRNVTWGDKIKASHWSRDPVKRDAVIKKRYETLCSSSEAYERWCDAISAGNARRAPQTSHSNHLSGWYISCKSSQREYHRSSYELARMLELDDDDSVVSWTVHHGISITYQFNGKQRHYLPDFLVYYSNKTTTLEEVKGYVSDTALHAAKCAAAIDYATFHGYTFIVNFMDHIRKRKRHGS